MFPSAVRPWIAIAALAAPLVCAASAEPEIQSIESMREAATTFLRQASAELGDSTTVEIGSIDPRLRLARCPHPLHAFLTTDAPKAGAVTVGLRCNALPRWTVYVSGRIHVERAVVVLAHSLTRGSVIGVDDIRVERRDAAYLPPGHIGDPAEALGHTLRRHLDAGAVLGARVLEVTPLVRRGERVTLIAHQGLLEVRSHGRALADGARGEVVAVRNLRSRRVIEGEVVAAGIVGIRM